MFSGSWGGTSSQNKGSGPRPCRSPARGCKLTVTPVPFSPPGHTSCRHTHSLPPPLPQHLHHRRYSPVSIVSPLQAPSTQPGPPPFLSPFPSLALSGSPLTLRLPASGLTCHLSPLGPGWGSGGLLPLNACTAPGQCLPGPPPGVLPTWSPAVEPGRDWPQSCCGASAGNLGHA